MTTITDQDLAGMHPRQADALRSVPQEARGAVVRRAHFLQNTGGGILSGALYRARQEFEALGSAEALDQRTRHENRRVMASCCPDCRATIARQDARAARGAVADVWRSDVGLSCVVNSLAEVEQPEDQS